MKTQVVFFINKRKFSAILTRIFTGCYCYHVGFVNSDYLYDMSWMRRRAKWNPQQNTDYVIFDSPVDIPEEYFIDQILNNNTHYGFKDYAMFLFRPFQKLLQTTRNDNKGVICSEMVNKDLIKHGWKSPFHVNSHPPSPCDLLKHFCNKYEMKEKL